MIPPKCRESVGNYRVNVIEQGHELLLVVCVGINKVVVRGWGWVGVGFSVVWWWLGRCWLLCLVLWLVCARVGVRERKWV